jgi:hypothetical protein
MSGTGANSMAQLKEDEWPKDEEPTTAEKERGRFKREGPHPPARDPDSPIDPTDVGVDEEGIDPPPPASQPGKIKVRRS